MEGEGQKVELKQRVSETKLTMAEVMPGVVPSSFKDIESLIFDSPSRSSGVCDGLYIGFIDRQRGDEVIFIQGLVAAGHAKRYPIDFKCVLAVSDRNVIEPLEVIGFKLIAFVFASLLMGRQVSVFKIFLDEFMRARFTGEDEVTVGVSHDALANGLMSIEVIA